MASPTFVPLPAYQEYPVEEMKRRAAHFYADIRRRRTVREFSDRPVPPEVIKDCLRSAGQAEKEEREFYHHKAPQEWLDALAPLGTDENKPYLETAPYLIVIFAQSHGVSPNGRNVKHYYAQESVGIATGFLITAIHHAGLVSLTHTPNPMRFLNDILDRPAHERPFLILVVGYPAEGARVPAITKKPLEEIATFL